MKYWRIKHMLEKCLRLRFRHLRLTMNVAKKKKRKNKLCSPEVFFEFTILFSTTQYLNSCQDSWNSCSKSLCQFGSLKKKEAEIIRYLHIKTSKWKKSSRAGWRIAIRYHKESLESACLRETTWSFLWFPNDFSRNVFTIYGKSF